jgi:Family of unknown function (DUF5317)
VFILYALVIGLAVGLLLGGRPSGLGELQFRWAWVFLAGILIQVALFSDPVTARIGDLGAPIYVLSTGLVLAAVLANRRIAGMPVVAVGAASNLAAIVANGGYMPASAGAMAALGRTPPSVYSNSTFVADPMLAALTDIFALPGWLPWTNVFSVGDVLIAIGVVVVLVAAMRRPPVAAVGAA